MSTGNGQRATDFRHAGKYKMENLKYYLRDFSEQVSWDHCCDTRMQIYDELRRLQNTYELKQDLQDS